MHKSVSARIAEVELVIRELKDQALAHFRLLIALGTTDPN
jgi:hypothetical protein